MVPSSWTWRLEFLSSSAEVKQEGVCQFPNSLMTALLVLRPNKELLFKNINVEVNPTITHGASEYTWLFCWQTVPLILVFETPDFIVMGCRSTQLDVTHEHLLNPELPVGGCHNNHSLNSSRSANVSSCPGGNGLSDEGNYFLMSVGLAWASIKHQIYRTANSLPDSKQLDRHPVWPEAMQRAESVYKTSAALTNTQVQSCIKEKGF